MYRYLITTKVSIMVIEPNDKLAIEKADLKMYELLQEINARNINLAGGTYEIVCKDKYD